MTDSKRYLVVLLLVILANFWVSWDHHTTVLLEWNNLKAALEAGVPCVFAPHDHTPETSCDPCGSLTNQSEGLQ